MSVEDVIAETVRRVLREELDAVDVSRRSESWLDTDAAAEYLSTTPASVRDMVRRHGLPAHRADGTARLLFRPSELDEWVEGPR